MHECHAQLEISNDRISFRISPKTLGTVHCTMVVTWMAAGYSLATLNNLY